MQHSCLNCGLVVTGGTTICPKCDARVHAQLVDEVLVVDVAHRGETWNEAELAIHRAIDRAIQGRYRGLKIIHGYGSGTGGDGVIGRRAKAVLRQWARQHQARYASDRRNPGASLLYFG